MTNEELAARIQAGEQDCYLELWEQVERFVSMRAGKTARKADSLAVADQDDYFQSGYLAMLQAAQSYDRGAGLSFIGWLDLHLRSAFAEVGGYRGSRKHNPLRFAVSLDAPLVAGEDFALIDTIADPSDHYEEAERAIWQEQLHAELGKALDALPELERATIRRRFYEGMTLKACAEADQVALETVRQRESHGLRKLRHPRHARPLREFIEERTDYYRHVSTAAFRRTGSSTVELAVLQRERLEAAYPRS